MSLSNGEIGSTFAHFAFKAIDKIEALALSASPFVNRTGGVRFLSAAAQTLKLLYDADVFSEEAVIAWGQAKEAAVKLDPDIDVRFLEKAAQQVNMADRRNPNCEAVRRWPWGRWLDCRPSCRSPALIARRRQPLRDRPSGRLIDEEAARIEDLLPGLQAAASKLLRRGKARRGWRRWRRGALST